MKYGKQFASSSLKPLFISCLWASLALAQTTTQIDANTQIRNWRLTPLNNGTPQGKVNLYTYDNHAIIQKLINNANTTGLCQVYLPAGIWYTSMGFDVPTCVEIQGVGFGQGTLFSGPKLGPVIQAQSGFSGPANYPSHFMLMIDGSTTVGAESDTYNVNVHGITFDCAGVSGCSGLYVGHANENVSVHDSVFANWSDYGEFHCGAGLGESPGLPYQYCGDNGSGPYFNNQLVSYGSWVTNNSYPLVIMSSLGNRPWSNYTINTTAGPVSAVLFQGLGLSLSNIHIENSTNGVVMGPTSGLCASMPGGAKCLGLQVSSVNQISLGPTGAGYAIINQNSQSTSISQTRSDGQTAALLFDQHNGVTVPNSYNGQYYLQDSGGCFSVEYCASFPSQISAPSELIYGSSPTLTIKNNTAPFPYHAFTENAGGELTIGGSGGLGNILLTDGNGVLSLRSAASSSYNGLNLQSPLLANSSAAGPVNAVFGSDVYWDTVNANWKFGNIGGTGYSAVWGSQSGGLGISISAASQPGTVSAAQFITNTPIYVNSAGNVLLRNPGSGGAYNASDNGSELQVYGSQTVSANLTVNGTITASGGLNYGQVISNVPSCTTGGSAFSTCTTTVPLSPRVQSLYANCFLADFSLQGGAPIVGVPVVVGYSINNALPNGHNQIVVTIANLTSVAASGSLTCVAGP